jgi:PAS domain S-box-containing protein
MELATMRTRKVTHGDEPAYALDGAATARAVLDREGRVVEWNEGAGRLLGRPAAEVVGRPAAELLAPEASYLPPPPGSLSWSGTLALRHRDGHTVTVWLLAHQRGPKDGDGSGGWLVLCPLDDPGPLVRDDPLAAAVMVQSPCAMAVFDDRLRLRGINDVMADAVGIPEKKLRGLHMSEIVGGRQGEKLEEHLREVLALGRRKDVQTFLRAADENRAHAWSAAIAPLCDDTGRPIGVCVTGHDITEQYLARQRLQLVNEASIRIGTTLDVRRTAQELADVCVPTLADFVSVDLMQSLDHGDEPHEGPLSAPFTLRRTAHQSITPGCPEAVVEIGRTDVYPATSPQAASLSVGHTIVATDPANTLVTGSPGTRHAARGSRNWASTPPCRYRSGPAARHSAWPC